MSDIQNPSGFELNETIDGANDLMHIHQPGSAGTRRNKRIIVDTLKAFFQIVIGAVSGNIVTFNGSASIQDSGVAVADIGDNTTHRSSDGKSHFDVANSLKGMNRIVLTNYTTTGVPAIAANSQVEINGNIYTNPLGVTISGATVNNTWYDILLAPSGTTFVASFVPRGTGIWSDSKQGLYTGNSRVVACAYRSTSSSIWINKNILIVNNRKIEIEMEIGDWDMNVSVAGLSSVSVVHGLLDHLKVKNVQAFIINDLSTSIIPINRDNGGAGDTIGGSIAATGSTTVQLKIVTTGAFDNNSYDLTPFNRGPLTIEYEV